MGCGFGNAQVSAKAYHLTSLAGAPLRPVVTKSGEQLSLQLDLSAAAGFNHLRVSFERIAPGARQAPPHRHSTREEGFLVLQGRGLAIVEGERVAVAPGDVVLFPPGTEAHHALVNDGPDDLDLFVFSADAGGDETTYAGSSTGPKLAR